MVFILWGAKRIVDKVCVLNYPTYNWYDHKPFSAAVTLLGTIRVIFGMKVEFGEKPTMIPTAFNYRLMILEASFVFLSLLLYACINPSAPKRISGEACLEREIKRLENLPEERVITTLDDQEICLNDFDRSSVTGQPGCFLPYKFYHWRNDVKDVSSQGFGRRIKHKIRAYYNLTSTCYPKKKCEDCLVYGDVAEFYDKNHTFMGFAVHLGQGFYCPLPHSGYAGPDSLEAATTYWNRDNKWDIYSNERKEG